MDLCVRYYVRVCMCVDIHMSTSIGCLLLQTYKCLEVSNNMYYNMYYSG